MSASTYPTLIVSRGSETSCIPPSPPEKRTPRRGRDPSYLPRPTTARKGPAAVSRKIIEGNGLGQGLRYGGQGRGASHWKEHGIGTCDLAEATTRRGPPVLSKSTGPSPAPHKLSTTMYLVELRPGKEELYRTGEELAAAIRSGDVDVHSRIYHRATSKWISVTLHPHYKAIAAEREPSRPRRSSRRSTSGAGRSSTPPLKRWQEQRTRPILLPRRMGRPVMTSIRGAGRSR